MTWRHGGRGGGRLGSGGEGGDDATTRLEAALCHCADRLEQRPLPQLYVKKPERRKYLKDAYRVLLTRTRQGMVIFVPPGVKRDGIVAMTRDRLASPDIHRWTSFSPSRKNGIRPAGWMAWTGPAILCAL